MNVVENFLRARSGTVILVEHLARMRKSGRLDPRDKLGRGINAVRLDETSKDAAPHAHRIKQRAIAVEDSAGNLSHKYPLYRGNQAPPQILPRK